jgi:hypothetical protein
MISVKLYGDLRKKQSSESTGGIPSIIAINDNELSTISDLLRYLDIKPNETSHIFVNGTYSGFSKKITSGDNIGIFPKNMALLYKWYFQKEEDDETRN